MTKVKQWNVKGLGWTDELYEFIHCWWADVTWSPLLTEAAFLQWWTQKGLSRSPFKWLCYWIIAKFFLGFSLVRTSRGPLSADREREGNIVDEWEKQKETGRLIKYEEGWKQERDTVVWNWSFHLNFIRKYNREKERDRNTKGCVIAI